MFTSRLFTPKLYLTMGLLLSLQSPSQAASSFVDIPTDYWAKRYIENLNERGVIAGYADQTFQPNRPVSRAEFAVILAKSQGLAGNAHTGQSESTGFKDLPTTHWAAPAIQAIVKQGWMSGYPDHRFEPNRNITLAEMYAILAKAESANAMPSDTEANQVLAAYRDAGELPQWARIPVAKAVQSGITVTEKSTSKLSPNQLAVRANVATSVAKLNNPAFRDVASETPAPVQAQTPEATAPVQETISTVESCPAVNLVGKLRRGENPRQWRLVRADGKVFPLQLPEPNDFNLKEEQEVRVTGNLDPVTGTAENPIVTVQTLTAVEPYQPEPQPVVTEAVKPIAPVESNEDAVHQEPAKPISLYFPNLANLVSDPALMLGTPAQRTSPNEITPRKAVEAILNGPNEDERKRGYFMDQDLQRLSLGKLTIDPAGAASVIINAPGNFQFENTSVPARLSEQIRRTLKQFDHIQTVKVSVTDPKNKAIWISP